MTQAGPERDRSGSDAPAPFRCSQASRAAEESLAGTASTVRAFLLLECSGPWGVQAVRDCRLPQDLKAWLGRLEQEHRVRPLLIRRPGRRASRSAQVFVAWTGGPRPWLETAALDTIEDVRTIDLEALSRGESAGLTRTHEPVLCVCTHGRHDACCAELGRPLAAALAAEAPELTWEVSHIGGDRFAPNVLVLPAGLYYGRLDPSDAHAFVAAHRAGRLDVEHLRGRSSLPFPVQVAEVALRVHLDDDDLAAYPLLTRRRQQDSWIVQLEAAGQPWEVEVVVGSGAPRQLTCRAERANPPPEYRVHAVRKVDDVERSRT